MTRRVGRLTAYDARRRGQVGSRGLVVSRLKYHGLTCNDRLSKGHRYVLANTRDGQDG